MKKLTGIIVTILMASLLIFAIIACKKKKECNGNPKKNCICTMEYAPVCGCDNKTYGNGCEAECNGVKSYTVGECGI